MSRQVASRHNPECKAFEKKIREGKHYFVAMCAVERKLIHQCTPSGSAAGPLGIISGVLGADQEKEVVHFDTDNSFTLLAYEYFLEHGWYAPIKNPELRQQGAYRLYGATVVQRNSMIEDCAGNSVVADIKDSLS